MVDFDSRGNYNGKLLDVPVHRFLPEGITMLTGESLSRIPQRNRNAFEAVIDDFGKRSAKAQGLGAVITTVRKMLYTDHRLYIHRGERTVNGILKTGRKKLFIRDSVSGKMHEIEPLCVLDFYVHESKQRSGLGKVLFEEMLRCEGARPHELGYDRPSPKLLGFLRKHYSLSNYEAQANNFVVFKSYFDAPPPADSSSRARDHYPAASRQISGRRAAQPHAPEPPSFFSGGSEPDRRAPPGGAGEPARQHAEWPVPDACGGYGQQGEAAAPRGVRAIDALEALVAQRVGGGAAGEVGGWADAGGREPLRQLGQQPQGAAYGAPRGGEALHEFMLGREQPEDRQAGGARRAPKAEGALGSGAGQWQRSNPYAAPYEPAGRQPPAERAAPAGGVPAGDALAGGWTFDPYEHLGVSRAGGRRVPAGGGFAGGAVGAGAAPAYVTRGDQRAPHRLW